MLIFRLGGGDYSLYIDNVTAKNNKGQISGFLNIEGNVVNVTAGTVRISNSIFINQTITGSVCGAAILCDNANLYIDKSDFLYNTCNDANSQGGAILVYQKLTCMNKKTVFLLILFSWNFYHSIQFLWKQS